MDSEFLDNKRKLKVKLLRAINFYDSFSVSLLFAQKKKMFRPINYKLSKVTDRFEMDRFRVVFSLLFNACEYEFYLHVK